MYKFYQSVDNMPISNLTMLWFAVLAVWCASGCAHAHDKPFYPAAAHARHFEQFKLTYNKQYATPEEERMRYEIFKNNLNDINELNSKFKETVYGINNFSDLTTEEVTALYTGIVPDRTSNPKSSLSPTSTLSVDIPETFDWRDEKVVTRVRNQGLCRSSWAFAAIGSLESNYARKNNKLLEFSVRALLDCSLFLTLGHNCIHPGRLVDVCSGDLHELGAMLEEDYPYVPDYLHDCLYNRSKVVAHAKVCENYAEISEYELQKLLITKGPLAVTIDSTNMIKYDHGLLTDCSHRTFNYAALLVGYGFDDLPYWTLKVSWGEQFGEKGYVKIYRGVHCLGLGAKGSSVVSVDVK